MDSGMDRVYHWDTSQGLYAVRPSNVPGNASIPCAQPKYAKVTSTWRLHGKSLPNLGINQAHMLIEMRAWTQRERESERERVGFGFVYIFICYYFAILLASDLILTCRVCVSGAFWWRPPLPKPRRSGDLFLAAWTGIQLFGTFRPGLWLVRQIQSSKYFDVGIRRLDSTGLPHGERERDIYITI